jgi:hypothetical protein
MLYLANTTSNQTQGSTGCHGETPLDAALASSGFIAMVDRGGCSFGQKADVAMAAGFAGLIIVNSDNDQLAPGLGEECRAIIPVVGIPRDIGDGLREQARQMPVYNGDSPKPKSISITLVFSQNDAQVKSAREALLEAALTPGPEVRQLTFVSLLQTLALRIDVSTNHFMLLLLLLLLSLYCYRFVIVVRSAAAAAAATAAAGLPPSHY